MMQALPIDVESKRNYPNAEMRTGRNRRFSIDPAKQRWYKRYRTMRDARRFLGTAVMIGRAI